MRSTFTKFLGIIIVFLFLAYTQEVQSAYIEKFPTEITQPDGTRLNFFATGDEFYNWLHDANGYTIIQNPETGWYVYGTKENGRIVPTEYKAGKVDPSQIGIMPWLKTDFSIIKEENKSFIQTKKMQKPGLKNQDKQMAVTGTINNLVVYIRFSDDPEFTDNQSTYENMFNTTGQNSMKDYFIEATYNQLTVNSAFYPSNTQSIVISYQDSYQRGYYQPYSTSNTIGYQGGNNGTQRRDREHILLRNAISYISGQVPPALNLDYDNDGYVDNVCFIVYGTTTAWATLLWPHQWSLYSQTATINSKRVWDYNMQIRSHLLTYANGVLCHEMYHTIGSPDLYHYSGDGMQPVYQWDLMENNTNPPQHMGSYMKWKYGGWITTIPEITAAGTYTLNPVTSSTNNCYKIASPRSSNEFFIVEYRRKTGRYENSLPGSGLLIYRINPAYNGNANGPPDEVYLYRPNGTTSVNGSPASANYSAETGRIAINNLTNPKAFLSNGSDSDLSIDQISSAGSSISFRVNFAVTGRPQLSTPASGSTEIALTPTLTWLAYTGASGYQLEVSELSDFSTKVVNLSDYTQTNYSIGTNLKMNTTYYWRVKARVGANFSEWSDVWMFTTARGIRTDDVTGVFCAGSAVTISFNASPIFQPGNTYIAQLSDSSGRFNRPINIGLLGSSDAGNLTIDAVLPDTIATGYNYKFRVISTTPTVLGSPTANGYLIIAKLDPVISDLRDTACIVYTHRYYTSELPYLTYNWTILGGNIISASNLSYVDVIWDKKGKGWLKVEQFATTGCNASTLKNVEIIGLPEAKYDRADTIVCQGGTGFYTANDDTKMKTKFEIYGGRIDTKYGPYNIKIRWDTLGYHKVVLIQFNAGGCPDTVVATVHVVPAPSAKITGNNSVCGLSTVDYQTNLIANQSYQWTATNGTIIGGDSKDFVKVKWNEKGAANLQLTVTDKITQCDVVDNMPVTLTPNVKAQIFGRNIACQSRNMTYYYVINPGDSVIKWFLNGSELPETSDTIDISFAASGPNVLSLFRLNKNGCSDSLALTVNVSETPPAPVIEQRKDTLYSNAPEGNIWFFNDAELTDEYGNYILPKKSGNYSAKVTNADLCRSDMSNVIDFLASDVEQTYENLSVYPTITSSGVNILFRNNSNDNAKIQLSGSLGQILFTRELSEVQNGHIEYLDMSNLPQGTYFIRIVNGTKSNIVKILLIK